MIKLKRSKLLTHSGTSDNNFQAETILQLEFDNDFVAQIDLSPGSTTEQVTNELLHIIEYLKETSDETMVCSSCSGKGEVTIGNESYLTTLCWKCAGTGVINR